MNKPLIFIKHHSPHHASHSGYSRILDYIDGEIISGESSPIPYFIRKKIANLFSKKYGIYNTYSIQKDFALAKRMMQEKNGIAHYLNGERDIRLCTIIKSLNNWKLTATFHKPPEIISKDIEDFKYLKRLDSAIAVASNQLDFLEKKVGINNIQFIPHGVDTDFYYPNKMLREPYCCIFVGQHMRDFKTLNSCIPIIGKKYPFFKLKVVLLSNYANHISKSKHIEFYHGITDEHLLELYHRSNLLLLPLTNVTACNSVLEALACGLPVVTTNLEGNRNYLNESCSMLLNPNDYNSMAEAVISLLENDQFNDTISTNARNQSLNYSWTKIANYTSDFFQKII